MNIHIEADYPQLCAAVARRVIACVKHKPEALICIAGGDTPLGVFDALVAASKSGEIDFSHARFVGLDEWLGLGKQDKGSCRQMVWSHFFDRLSLRDEQICFFDGLTDDTRRECQRVDDFIAACGRIDMLVLGIGMNGHIGFNEPGVSRENRCHVVDLDPITQAVSVKYFGGQRDVRQGISLGLKTLLDAQHIIMMASGEPKRAIVERTLCAEISVAIPSTLIRQHEKAELMVDRAASSAQCVDS
nr:glucosamine-6-phosphate deaminase [uncultured Enterobacter sp.]